MQLHATTCVHGTIASAEGKKNQRLAPNELCGSGLRKATYAPTILETLPLSKANAYVLCVMLRVWLCFVVFLSCLLVWLMLLDAGPVCNPTIIRVQLWIMFEVA